MNKPALTDHDIYPLLRDRWSPRAFAPVPVTLESIASLFEAARWASSSMNEQPWRFLVAERANEEEFSHALSCLMDGNALWAKSAGLLIFTVFKQEFSHNNKPNGSAAYDLGLAVANLVIQATSLGLSCHQMGGIYPEKVREIYGVPEGYVVQTAIAVGEMGDIEQLPDGLKEREIAARTRKPLSEVVFQGTWGQSLEIV